MSRSSGRTPETAGTYDIEAWDASVFTPLCRADDRPGRGGCVCIRNAGHRGKHKCSLGHQWPNVPARPLPRGGVGQLQIVGGSDT